MIGTIDLRAHRAAIAAFAVFATALMLLLAVPEMARAQQTPPGPAPGTVPGETVRQNSDSQFWREIRKGTRGNVSIPDKKAGQLIQSEGDNWRSWRNGPVSTYGVWGLLGIIILLAVFFLLRGRIGLEGKWAKATVERFNSLDRFSHWLLAVSFIILGLTGLNTLYGRYALLPIFGKDAFATVTLWGKWLHNYVAWAFMIALVMVLVLWIKDNFPRSADLKWLAKGGGMFSKGSHPPAWKFNAGQKILFWLVILGGISVSLSGLALLFPFQIPLFAKTFAVFNIFGTGLPTDLSMVQEMQLAQAWHAIVSLILMIVVIAHIYIGTLGMEGAFSAMSTGHVDTNWAKEHHPLWAAQVAGAGAPPPSGDANDDLQEIDGIGPKIARQLRGMGYTRFEQIAAWDKDEVERVNDHLKFKGRIQRERWVQQARKLASQG